MKGKGGVRGRGRPKRGGSLHYFIRISDNLREFINLERRIGERDCDTISRILQEKTERIKSLVIENDQFREQIKELKLNHGNPPPSTPSPLSTPINDDKTLIEGLDKLINQEWDNHPKEPIPRVETKFIDETSSE
jgi:hypothetical protein